jgi:hypothetical protein
MGPPFAIGHAVRPLGALLVAFRAWGGDLTNRGPRERLPI